MKRKMAFFLATVFALLCACTTYADDGGEASMSKWTDALFEYDQDTEDTIECIKKTGLWKLPSAEKRLTGEMDYTLQMPNGSTVNTSGRTGYTVYSLKDNGLCYLFFVELPESGIGYVPLCYLEYPSDNFELYREKILECDWPENILNESNEFD